MTSSVTLSGSVSPRPVQPQRSADADNRPRVLVLTSRFPYPALGGDKLTLLNYAKALRHYRLTLLSFCSSRNEMERDPEDDTFAEIHRVFLHKGRSLRNVLVAVPTRTPLQLAYYWSPEFQRKVEDLAPRHDLLFAHLIRTGQYLTGSRYEAPRILFMADAISLTYDRMMRQKDTPSLWSMIYRMERSRLNAYERACPSQFHQTWLHSDIDRRFLKLSPRKTHLIPIGIDLKEFPFQPARVGNVVVFIGNMASSMNQDACRHFVRDILPSLQAKAGVRFRAIGPCPPKLRSFLEKHPGVEVTGAVQRIADAVDGGFCGICCIRGGAGMQNKVLNYLALGLPCVTSEIGLEGIPATPGRELIAYRTSDEAVEAILRLHSDAALRRTLAENGRKLVEEAFEWTRVHRTVVQEVSRLVPLREPQVA